MHSESCWWSYVAFRNLTYQQTNFFDKYLKSKCLKHQCFVLYCGALPSWPPFCPPSYARFVTGRTPPLFSSRHHIFLCLLFVFAVCCCFLFVLLLFVVCVCLHLCCLSLNIEWWNLKRQSMTPYLQNQTLPYYCMLYFGLYLISKSLVGQWGFYLIRPFSPLLSLTLGMSVGSEKLCDFLTSLQNLRMQ